MADNKVVNSIKLYVLERWVPSQEMIDAWADNAKRNAPRLYAKMKAQIPDPQAYADKIADPSAFKFKNVINPAFVSKSGRTVQAIENAQRANIMRAFGKYETKRDHMFETVDDEPAKRFCELIDQSKDNFGDGIGARTMRFTGDRASQLGVAPRAAKWFAGENILVRAEYDSLLGSPVNVAKTGLQSQMKAAIMSRLVQSGIAIVHAEMSSASLTAENTLINELMTSLANDTVYAEFTEPYAALKSYCGYVVEGGQLYLKIQVAELVA